MTSSMLETFTKPREKNASEHTLASARLSKPTNFEMDAFTKKKKKKTKKRKSIKCAIIWHKQ